MAEQLQGRQLDEAVARILGTTNSIDINPADVPYAPSGMRSPHYSTDAATLPEMLAWLHKQSVATVEISHYDAHHVSVCLRSGLRDFSHATGSSINEALARLCLAVAGAGREAGHG